jgi:hypothetical protein
MVAERRKQCTAIFSDQVSGPYNQHVIIITIFSGSAAQRGLRPSRIMRFRDHTQRRATLSRTPLDEFVAETST